MDNWVSFRDLEINEMFIHDGSIWMKTYERARSKGGALNAFDMRRAAPNFEHVDGDEVVKVYKPKMRRKRATN